MAVRYYFSKFVAWLNDRRLRKSLARDQRKIQVLDSVTLADDLREAAKNRIEQNIGKKLESYVEGK